MSAVKQALSRLHKAIGSLEVSMNTHEAALRGQQRDMFAMPLPQASNSNLINADLVAERLDGAIARIESVLKEGHG